MKAYTTTTVTDKAGRVSIIVEDPDGKILVLNCQEARSLKEQLTESIEAARAMVPLYQVVQDIEFITICLESGPVKAAKYMEITFGYPLDNAIDFVECVRSSANTVVMDRYKYGKKIAAENYYMDPENNTPFVKCGICVDKEVMKFLHDILNKLDINPPVDNASSGGVLKPGSSCPAGKSCGVDSYICEEKHNCKYFKGSPGDKGEYSNYWVLCDYNE